MSWSEVGNKGGNNSASEKVEYVKWPSPGVIKGRILDEQPESRWTHFIPQANGGKGFSVRCPGKGCPICAEVAAAKKAKQAPKYGNSKSHAINFLVRSFTPAGGTPVAINKVQVLDKGNTVFEGLVAIMEQMGDLRNYDVTITMTMGAAGKPTYNVLPTFPPAALTAEELALQKYDIKELTKEFTLDQIQKFMTGATIEQVIGNGNAPNDAPTATDNSAVDVDFTQQA